MTMQEFAQVIKKSNIAGSNMNKIIYQLLQALGAKPAINEAAMAGERKVSDQSPSNSTIHKWLKEKPCKPRVSKYFPNLKVESGENAHKFLSNVPQTDKWKELRDLFAEWYKENKKDKEVFYIKTDTDDFKTFSTSFWKQFISYFEPLRMWDGANNELESETEKSNKNSKSCIAYEMVCIFKESFMQHKIYEFIPKNIDDVLNSLGIYFDILNENLKLTASEDAGSDYGATQEPKKMYCTWYPDHIFFEFCAATRLGCLWVLKTTEEYRILRFDENFDFDKMQTNIWLVENFEYAISNQDLKDPQYYLETLIWEQCQGKILIVDVDKQAAQDYPIVDDCKILIDEMLDLNLQLDIFIDTINENIIKKYSDVMLDNDSKWIYIEIKHYRQSLDDFRSNLATYRNLEKEKSQYFNNLAFKNMFGMYSAFPDFESSQKPHYPFSELYLNPKEAEKVKSNLRRYHQNLIKTYENIINYGKFKQNQ